MNIYHYSTQTAFRTLLLVTLTCISLTHTSQEVELGGHPNWETVEPFLENEQKSRLERYALADDSSAMDSNSEKEMDLLAFSRALLNTLPPVSKHYLDTLNSGHYYGKWHNRETHTPENATERLLAAAQDESFIGGRESFI